MCGLEDRRIFPIKIHLHNSKRISSEIYLQLHMECSNSWCFFFCFTTSFFSGFTPLFFSSFAFPWPTRTRQAAASRVSRKFNLQAKLPAFFSLGSLDITKRHGQIFYENLSTGFGIVKWLGLFYSFLIYSKLFFLVLLLRTCIIISGKWVIVGYFMYI